MMMIYVYCKNAFNGGFTNPGQYGIVLGAYQRDDTVSERNLHRLVKSILLHPGFFKKSRGKEDDVAMIKVLNIRKQLT